jgi:hypothetical protein
MELNKHNTAHKNNEGKNHMIISIDNKKTLAKFNISS